MDILIDTIRVSGFRGIQNIEISLPRVAVLIGPNNAGKTTVIKALQLALGDYSRYLSEEDFHVATNDERATEILVDVRIVPISDNEQRTAAFSEQWQSEFGDKIQLEANNNQFLAIRTRALANAIKGGFDITRATLETWLPHDVWANQKTKETKLNTRFSSLPFISMEAQRDIHQDLRDRSSFIGRILSSVEYNKDDVAALETLIQEVNEQAVNKSSELKNLKSHLEKLNQSVGGSGGAEVTPFPKKIRDLSKNFSVHFGDTDKHSFSMEYHGMGTRSWASILTVKSFIEMLADRHAQEYEPLFPILAAEEPEAHLHPNAQKTLYRQLSAVKGQLIISTHSPYIAAMAEQHEIRYLKKTPANIESKQLDQLDEEERRKIQREIIHSRGEILFSKALVLCEGETEEQALPLLFQKYFGHEAFVLGVSFIGVGGSGKKYLPFLRFAKSFDIPVFIFSDGEEKAITELKRNYEAVFGVTDIQNCQNITVLDGTDFEGYLISSGFTSTIKSAIELIDGVDSVSNWMATRNGTSKGRKQTNKPKCPQCQQPIFEDVIRNYGDTNDALIDILDSQKTKYAPVIAEKLCELEKTELPPKIIEFFEKIKTGASL